MDVLATWDRFLMRRRNAPPLSYVSGMRIPLKQGVSCPVHAHTDIEIVYHPRGRGVTRLERGDERAFTEGAAVVYAPFEQHDQFLECDGEDLCVAIAIPADVKVVPKCGFNVQRVEDAAIIEDMRVLSQLRYEISPAQQAIFNLRATSTLFALIDLAKRRREAIEDVGEGYVLKAEQYVRENFASQISLGDAADFAGIGYDHLRHLTRIKRKRSLIQYLTEVRIEHAKTLLAHSEILLSEIAVLSGFRNEHYFSAVFRRSVGCPPGRYREKQAKREAAISRR